MSLVLPVLLQAKSVQIEGVRYRATSERMRMVFDLSKKVKYDVFLLEKPARLVIDFANTQLAKSLAQPSKRYKLLSRVRSGSRNKKDMRVVVDLKGKVKPKNFTLGPNKSKGHRLVIDLYSAKKQTKKTSASKAAAKKRLAKKKVKKVYVSKKKKSTKKLYVSKKKKTVKKDKKLYTSKKKPVKKDKNLYTSKKKPVKKEKKSYVSKNTQKTYINKAKPKKVVKRAHRNKKRNIVIAIDPGHGGKDPGARGPKGTQEKTVVFAIAKKLEKLFNKKHGMKAVLTRKNDSFIPLGQRAEIARVAKADLFISIHADAFRSAKVKGASVYVVSNKGASTEAAKWLAKRENSADLVGGVKLSDKDDMLAFVLMDLSKTETKKVSRIVAEKILHNLKKIGSVHNGRVQNAGFKVLKSPDIPSILVETAFISNPSEERLLRSSRHQAKMARAIYKGVVSYFNEHVPTDSYISANKEHTISNGETLSGTAQRYGVSLRSIKSMNALASKRIRTGQVLKIPRG